MTDNQQIYDDSLFDQKKSFNNEYSTFIEQLQESTQKLIDEVFNSKYYPDMNDNQNEQDNFETKKRKHLTKNKEKNMKNPHARSNQQYHLSDSFVNFLQRNQKWKERKVSRATMDLSKKQEQQLKNLTFIPTILRGSKEKIQPIYERCLDLHKQKQKKIQTKKLDKEKKQRQQQKKLTFQPEINNKGTPRTLQEYLRDKQVWQQNRKEYIQNSKIIRQARKYEQCIFSPILVTKYHDKRKDKNEKVQDRLLRSLEKSIQKKMAKQVKVKK